MGLVFGAAVVFIVFMVIRESHLRHNQHLPAEGVATQDSTFTHVLRIEEMLKTK
jgi:hypothetical protein